MNPNAMFTPQPVLTNDPSQQIRRPAELSFEQGSHNFVPEGINKFNRSNTGTNSGVMTPHNEVQMTFNREFPNQEQIPYVESNYRRQQTIATERPIEELSKNPIAQRGITAKNYSEQVSQNIYESQHNIRTREAPQNQFYSTRQVQLTQPGIVTADKLRSLYSQPPISQQHHQKPTVLPGETSQQGGFTTFQARNSQNLAQISPDLPQPAKLSNGMADNQPRNKMAKVTRYSYNADGTKTLLSDEYLPLNTFPSLIDGPIPGADPHFNSHPAPPSRSRTSFQNLQPHSALQPTSHSEYGQIIAKPVPASTQPSGATASLQQSASQAFSGGSFGSRHGPAIEVIPGPVANRGGPVVVEVDMSKLRRQSFDSNENSNSLSSSRVDRNQAEGNQFRNHFVERDVRVPLPFSVQAPTFSSQIFGGQQVVGQPSVYAVNSPKKSLEELEKLSFSRPEPIKPKQESLVPNAFDFAKKNLGQNVQIEIPRFEPVEPRPEYGQNQPRNLQTSPLPSQPDKQQQMAALQNLIGLQDFKTQGSPISQGKWNLPWAPKTDSQSEWEGLKTEKIQNQFGFQQDLSRQIPQVTAHTVPVQRELTPVKREQPLYQDYFESQPHQRSPNDKIENQKKSVPPQESQLSYDNQKVIDKNNQESRKNIASQITEASRPDHLYQKEQKNELPKQLNQVNFNSGANVPVKGATGIPQTEYIPQGKTPEQMQDTLLQIQAKLDNLYRQKNQEEYKNTTELPPIKPAITKPDIGIKPQVTPKVTEETQLSGPMAEREKMFRKSATPLNLVQPPVNKELNEQTRLLKEKRTRDSAKVDISSVKEPFLEEINSKQLSSSQTVTGPYKDKRTRNSAKDNMESKIKIIENRREKDETKDGSAIKRPPIERLVEGSIPAARPETQIAQNKPLPSPVYPSSPIPQKSHPQPQQPQSQSEDPNKAVQIVYKQINGKNYPVKIDSTVLGPFEKEMLLKHLLEKEGMTIEMIEELQHEADQDFNNRENAHQSHAQAEKPHVEQKPPTPFIPVETITAEQAKHSSARALEFDVAPITEGGNYFDWKYSSLLTNVQDQIITEEEEGASKSSRRESVYIGDTDSIDLNPKEIDGAGYPTLPAHVNPDESPVNIDLKKKSPSLNMGDPLKDTYSSGNLIGIKSDLLATSSNNLDLASLLKRNEEMMRLISQDVGDLSDVPELNPIPSIKKTGRGIKNNLSEKYKSGMISTSGQDGLSGGSALNNLSDLKSIDSVDSYLI
jgi:hypothetical protein